MIIEKDKLKPIYLFGMLCLFTSLVAVISFFKQDESGFKAFSAVVATSHFIVAMGISFRTLWGFKLLKAYLYILLIGFPIGTVLARYLLRHLEEHSIKEFFGKKSLEI